MIEIDIYDIDVNDVMFTMKINSASLLSLYGKVKTIQTYDMKTLAVNGSRNVMSAKDLADWMRRNVINPIE